MVLRSLSSLSRASVSALALAACLASQAQAQETNDGLFDLGTLVIVGTGLPTEVRDNPASATALGETEIRRVPPSSVAQILSQVPGVRVTQSGIERLRIRGEASRRVAILVDGQPLTDHTGYGTPILVSPANIDRIEIVRGSSSVVSGNNAIGGVVNIITKRGADKPLEVEASTAYFSATQGHRSSLSVAGSGEAFDYRLSYSKSELGDLHTTDGTLENSDVSDQELALHLGYRTGNHYFGLKAQDFDLAANVGTGDSDFSIKLPKRDLRKVGVFYEGEDLTPWLKKLRLDAYTQEIEREFLNDIFIGMGPGRSMSVVSGSDDLQETWGLNAQAELSFSDRHRTIVGLSYESDSQIADKETVTTLSFLPFPTTTERYSDATIRTFSAYAQHEAALTDALTVTAGLRYYSVDSDRDTYRINGVDQGKSKNSDDRVLGALGLVYKPSEDVTYRANISQGYKYPTLGELYLETSAGSGGLTTGNPDLKPETSTTFEIGARVDREAFVFDGTLFYSEAQDYITTVPGAAPRTFTYDNVNSVKSWGVEVSAEYQSNLWNLRPYITAEFIQREFTYSNGYSTKDSGTPNFAATLGVRSDWSYAGVSGEWDIFATGEGAAKLRSSDGSVSTTSDEYATLNMRLTADLNDQFSVSFAANNLLNADYQPMGQYAGAERNFSIMLNARF